MKAISGKQMCKILEAKGRQLARVTGSHHIFVFSGQNTRISVPVHGNQDLKIGLQRAVLRLARIGEDELQDRRAGGEGRFTVAQFGANWFPAGEDQSHR